MSALGIITARGTTPRTLKSRLKPGSKNVIVIFAACKGADSCWKFIIWSGDLLSSGDLTGLGIEFHQSQSSFILLRQSSLQFKGISLVCGQLVQLYLNCDHQLANAAETYNDMHTPSKHSKETEHHTRSCW